jgi:hypothetical protein
MSNEEAKNLVIKTHWENAGFNWVSICKIVNERGELVVEDPVKFQATKEYHYAYKEDLIRPLGGSNGKYHYELYSLVGIDRNNGWTRIEEGGVNLPNSGNYYFYDMKSTKDDGKNQYVFDELRKEQFTQWFTHYRPIEVTPKPIY